MFVKTIAATALAVVLATTAAAFAQTWTHDSGIYSDRFQDRLVPGYTNSAPTNPTNGR
jgi:hypothetical protein